MKKKKNQQETIDRLEFELLLERSFSKQLFSLLEEHKREAKLLRSQFETHERTTTETPCSHKKQSRKKKD